MRRLRRRRREMGGRERKELLLMYSVHTALASLWFGTGTKGERVGEVRVRKKGISPRFSEKMVTVPRFTWDICHHRS